MYWAWRTRYPTRIISSARSLRKVLLFPEVIQPFGWDVIEYSNEGSASKAREHVVILTKDRLRALSRRKSREEPLDADVNNTELQQEFQRVLVEKIRSRAKPGDIVCHVWGPNMEVYNLLPDCQHIELSVGYTASPGLPFRVYESSAWMHWHYGKAGQEDGNHYKWVIPSPFDVDRWAFREEPDDYAIFLGRVTARKGINELVEIARRMPELPIHVYGPGDPSQWAKEAPANLMFKGPVFGDERVDVVRRARCMLMPTVFIEPFGFSGIEAQLCGVPLIASSYGAFPGDSCGGRYRLSMPHSGGLGGGDTAQPVARPAANRHAWREANTRKRWSGSSMIGL